MIPVTQDIFYNDPQGRKGNCFQAAIASIVEKPLNEVPHFAAIEDDTWWEQTLKFLNDNGYDVFHCEIAELPHVKDNLVLVVGKSQRGVNHSVIYKNGSLAHDPHPSKTGVTDISWLSHYPTISDVLK